MSYLPEKILRLYEEALNVARYMAYEGILDQHLPGYLIISDKGGKPIFTSEIVGGPNQSCDYWFAEFATKNNGVLSTAFAGRTKMEDGATSRQFAPTSIGSVVASNLIVGFAGGKYEDYLLASEAITIMFALRAGLLSKHPILPLIDEQRTDLYNEYLAYLFGTPLLQEV